MIGQRMITLLAWLLVVANLGAIGCAIGGGLVATFFGLVRWSFSCFTYDSKVPGRAPAYEAQPWRSRTACNFRVRFPIWTCIITELPKYMVRIATLSLLLRFQRSQGQLLDQELAWYAARTCQNFLLTSFRRAYGKCLPEWVIHRIDAFPRAPFASWQ